MPSIIEIYEKAIKNSMKKLATLTKNNLFEREFNKVSQNVPPPVSDMQARAAEDVNLKKTSQTFIVNKAPGANPGTLLVPIPSGSAAPAPSPTPTPTPSSTP